MYSQQWPIPALFLSSLYLYRKLMFDIRIRPRGLSGHRTIIIADERVNKIGFCVFEDGQNLTVKEKTNET